MEPHFLAQNKGETGGLGRFSNGQNDADANEKHQHRGRCADSQYEGEDQGEDGAQGRYKR